MLKYLILITMVIKESGILRKIPKYFRKIPKLFRVIYSQIVQKRKTAM